MAPPNGNDSSTSNHSDSEENSGEGTDSSMDLLASSPEPETPERKQAHKNKSPIKSSPEPETPERKEVHKNSSPINDGTDDSSVDLLASSPEPETPKRKKAHKNKSPITVDDSDDSSPIDSPPPKKKAKIGKQSRFIISKDTGDDKEEKTTSGEDISTSKKTDVAEAKVKIPDSISPELVDDRDSKAKWYVRDNFILVRRPTKSQQQSSQKTVAAFDLDQTLLLWKCAGWPSRPEHYELWSSSVISKLQSLHTQGYQIVIFTNQGGIRSAVRGKTAARVKGLINWIAKVANVPLWAVASTSTKSGYHKPACKMWEILETECSIKFDISLSFYVGDSDGSGGDGDTKSTEYQQKAVDKLFAENVGKLRKQTLKFHTPQDFFGESDASRRKALQQIEKYKLPPPSSHKVRAALLGKYLPSPILLILCGVQGSGKSTFCKKLLEYAADHHNDNENHWVHLSQDTINNGKPGKREAVEEAACDALEQNKSVVIDRMHLTPDQRSHFITLGQDQSVPVHIVMLSPSTDILMERVKNRTNHPGGVQGERGMQLTKLSLQNIIMPEYDEGGEDRKLALITCCTSMEAVDSLCLSYSYVGCSEAPSNGTKTIHSASSFPLHSTTLQQCSTASSHSGLPMVSLGTQKVGKRKAPDVIKLALEHGITAIDTAPTYNNEEPIGVALQAAKQKNSHRNDHTNFVILKIPKRATTQEQVRNEFEQSLQKLGGDSVALALLHWPCDLIEMDTLEVAWKEMELMVTRGECRFLGVCNFSVDALRSLLPLCKDVRPIVNQVERHPLLPQWDLLDFCTSQGILLQAHTPLGGHGTEELLQHPKVLQIVNEQGKQNENNTILKTAAQVLWKWNLQHNVAVVSKCTSEEHIKEYSSLIKSTSNKISDLLPSQMEILDSIGMEKNDQIRFVAPPFMYKAGAIYAWGDRVPTKRPSPASKK